MAKPMGLTVPASAMIAIGVFAPSANASERTIAEHKFGPELPDNAVIMRSFYDVITTFVSATDAATIALGIETDSADGLVTAIAISDGSNPYDAGLQASKMDDGKVATFVKTAAAGRQFVATVAVEALTAGKLLAVAEYIVTL